MSDAAPVNAIAPETKRLFEQAYEESANLGDRLIGSEHLLLAMLRVEALPELQRAGITCERVTREIRNLRRNGCFPDGPIVRANPFAPVARTIKNAAENIGKLYKVFFKLSVMHPKLVGDPHRLYDRIRAIAPLRRDPLLGSWVVTGYPEATAVLRDPRFSSEPRSNRTASGTMEIDTLPAGPVRDDLCVIAGVLTKMMVFSDPPAHSTMRGQMGQMFTSRNVASLRDRVQKIADDLIDAVAPRGRMDLIQDFARPLPLLVVADILGFPREDTDNLRRWSDGFGVTLSFMTSVRQDLESRAAMMEMRKYFDRVVESLRQTPNASLMSQLITPRDGSPPMNLDDLFANCVFLLAAGHETTSSTIGSGMRLLLKHPQELKRLMGNPDLLPTAIEELLRLESPVQWTSRRTREDLELAGRNIEKNSVVLISMGAANRDPRQFPDPHRLDITRKDAAKHLAFSGGNHFCLGAGLARIELHVAFATLFRRLRNLRIPDGFEVSWRPGHTLHTFDHLPITFEAAS